MIVVPTGENRLLATWSAWGPKLAFNRVVVSRSEDSGKTWSEPDIVDGGQEETSAWSLPAVAPNGRIYLLHSYYPDSHKMHSGRCKLALRCSDDGGRTWSERVLRDLRSSEVDGAKGPSFICARQAELDSQGRPLTGYSRLGMNARIKKSPTKKWTQSECLRIDNLADAPGCKDLKITYLPKDIDKAITVPQPKAAGMSWANEPSIVQLPDGRLFACVRTRLGHLYWSSSDGNGNFSKAQVMRYQDGGDKVLQPSSPAPLFRLDDGSYLLVFNNDDGNFNGAKDVHATRNRRPTYLAVGRFDPKAEQHLRFSEPVLFIDNDNIPVKIVGNSARYQSASYGSCTKDAKGYVLWYPDRKHYLVGKRIDQGLIEKLKKSLEKP